MFPWARVLAFEVYDATTPVEFSCTTGKYELSCTTRKYELSCTPGKYEFSCTTEKYELKYWKYFTFHKTTSSYVINYALLCFMLYYPFILSTY